MREVSLTLDFVCSACAEQLTMKVICRGVGLFQGESNAAVAVACPLCEEGNELVFDTAGNIHRVAPISANPILAGPSVN